MTDGVRGTNDKDRQVKTRGSRLVLVLALTCVLGSCVYFFDRFDGADQSLHQISSVNGVLDIALRAQPTKIAMGDVAVDGMTYNGDHAGPVLRVQPGDHLKIKLINGLDEPTNLHYHGLQTSPLGNSDNVHLSVDPGHELDYDVAIPAIQPPGLYWYHAHIHKASEHQVMGGLSGALVVEGIDKKYPALQGIKENLLVLKDMVFDDSPNPVISNQWHDRLTTVNGKTEIVLHAKPGETQFWRIGNHSANLYFHLKMAGLTFRVISVDGVAQNQETVTDVLHLGPATRYEVLVTAHNPGQYDLTAEGVPTGQGAEYSLRRRLVRLAVEGEAVPSLDTLALTANPDLRKLAITARRQIVFSQNADAGQYFVNGKLFDAARIDTRVPLGSIEEWTIRNDSDDLHVFHIHQVHFQLVELNGVAQPFVGYLDTVKVPERSVVKIILPFTNPLIVGKFMYHCHLLSHEDHGMMAQIEVVRSLSEGGDEQWAELCKADRILQSRPNERVSSSKEGK